MVEVSEERTSAKSSPSARGEIDDDNDLSMVPLLSPNPSLISYLETSTARSPEMEQEYQGDSRELKQVRATPLFMASLADIVLRAFAVMLSSISGPGVLADVCLPPDIRHLKGFRLRR